MLLISHSLSLPFAACVFLEVVTRRLRQVLSPSVIICAVMCAVVVIPCTAIAFTAPIPVPGEVTWQRVSDAQAATYLAAIRQAYREFETNLGSDLLIEYDVRELLTAEYFRSESKADLRQSEISDWQPHDVTFDVDARYARKGGRIHTSHAGPLVLPSGDLEPTAKRRARVFDGTRVVRLENVGKSQSPRLVYEVSSDPQRALEAYVAPWQASGQQLFLQVLDYREDHRQRCTSAVHVLEDRPGESRVKIELSWAGGMSYSATLNQDQFQLSGLLVRDTKGRLAQNYEVSEYVEQDGMAIPKYSRMQQFGESGLPLKVSETTVRRFTTAPADIDDSLFTLEIPKGATILDLDRGVAIPDPAQYRDLFNVDPVPRDKTTYVLVLNGLALAFLAIALVIRRWITVRRARTSEIGKE